MENVTAEQIEVLKSEGKKLLIQYTASWCGEPCSGLTPRLEALSRIYTDVTFVNVDIDANIDNATALGINTAPTVMIYDGDTLINISLGANVDSVYVKILDTL
jgi:thioredoxin-like negative regulator of GroEL